MMSTETRARNAPTHIRPARGFSLIELMIGVALLGILVSIAVPGYTQYLHNARRADARVSLLQASNQLEKFYSDNLAYTADLARLGLGSTSADAHYTLRIVSLAGPYYRVRAEASPASAQFNDLRCRILSVDSSGERQAQAADGADSTLHCW